MKAFLVGLLLGIALLTVCNKAHAAGSLFVSVDPQATLRNPVFGGVAFEVSGVRLGVAAGQDQRATANLDLVAHLRSGLILGAGVVADRLEGEDYSDVIVGLDSTTVTRRHDNGKHKGDKHQHGNRTFTTVRSYQRVLSFDGVDLGLSPSLFIGVGGARGLFAESRAVFNGGDVSNRVSVGLRW